LRVEGSMEWSAASMLPAGYIDPSAPKDGASG
jgi:hypothetical protein